MNNQRFFLIEFIVLILISPYIFMEKIYYFGLYKLLSIQIEHSMGYYDELLLTIFEPIALSLVITFILEYLFKEKIICINDLGAKAYKTLGFFFGIIGVSLLGVIVFFLFTNRNIDVSSLEKTLLSERKESSLNYFTIDSELDFSKKIVIKNAKNEQEQQFYIPLRTQKNIKYIILITGQYSDIFVDGKREKKVDFSRIGKVKFDAYLGKNKISEQAKYIFKKEGYNLEKDTYLIEPIRKVPYKGIMGILYTYGFIVFMLGIFFMGLGWTLFSVGNDVKTDDDIFEKQNSK